MKEGLSKLIKDKETNFLRKLHYAAENCLEYWEGGGRPENLKKEVLVRYLKNLDIDRELIPDMQVRKSRAGKYGKTGFDYVFCYVDTVNLGGIETRMYIKGFFFEKENPRGVEIQSFKKSRLQSVK